MVALLLVLGSTLAEDDSLEEHLDLLVGAVGGLGFLAHTRGKAPRDASRDRGGKACAPLR